MTVDNPNFCSKITQIIGFLDRSIDSQNQILKTNITSAPETVAAKSAIIKLNNLKTSWNLIKKSYTMAAGSLKKDDDGILRNREGKSIDDFLITVPVLGNSGGNTK